MLEQILVEQILLNRAFRRNPSRINVARINEVIRNVVKILSEQKSKHLSSAILFTTPMITISHWYERVSRFRNLY